MVKEVLFKKAMKQKKDYFDLYDGRKVQHLLKKIAKEKGKTYEEVREVFYEKITKPTRKRFKKACHEVFSK